MCKISVVFNIEMKNVINLMSNVNVAKDFEQITLSGADRQTSDFQDQIFFWLEAETTPWSILPCLDLKKII